MLTREQRIDRLCERVGELALWLDRAWLDLQGWEFEGAPIELGAPWPRRDGVLRIELRAARVPQAWPLHETWLEVAPGGEGLLRVDYGGRSQAFGLDPWHRRFPLRAPDFRLFVEAVARLPFGRPNPQPHLESARLVWTEPGLDRFLRRLRLIAGAAGGLGADDAAEAMISAAERALAALEWPSATEGYIARAAHGRQLRELWSPPRPFVSPSPLSDRSRESVHAADAALEEDLAGLRAVYPPRGRLGLTGQAHIDLAWLWPLEETRRKARRTFHTVVDLLDRYPEMTFVHSSGEAHELVREVDPELFERVRDLAAGGRWESAGGMWVEADMNMISGESIARQLLWGQSWLEREFGQRHRVGWLPDCFGFTPALPQLLRAAGLDGFFTTKLNWSETNRFPYDLFWWEGLDGTRVLAHMFRNEWPGLERAYHNSSERRASGLWDLQGAWPRPSAFGWSGGLGDRRRRPQPLRFADPQRRASRSE